MKVLRVSLFCIVLFLVAISSFSQERLISSGLLLSGGAGTLDYEFVDDLNLSMIHITMISIWGIVFVYGRIIGCFGTWMLCWE